MLSGEEFDEACSAVADFADIKSPSLLGHAHRSAELAGGRDVAAVARRGSYRGHTERALSLSPALVALGEVAAAHHERVGGAVDTVAPTPRSCR